ncbi:hypothetical protein ZWY2020_031890 [Hordeum vulgare]|nr:hypothetical protein ZWY2020_031890 [Hordeum vulgare]
MEHMLLPRDMPNWEVWSSFEEEVAAGAWGEDGAAEIGKEDAQSARLPLLPSLVLLALEGCPKLRALPRQLGKETTSLKELRLVGTNSLKAVEDLLLLSELLVIKKCEGLQRISNLPQVTELRMPVVKAQVMLDKNVAAKD